MLPQELRPSPQLVDSWLWCCMDTLGQVVAQEQQRGGAGQRRGSGAERGGGSGLMGQGRGGAAPHSGGGSRPLDSAAVPAYFVDVLLHTVQAGLRPPGPDWMHAFCEASGSALRRMSRADSLAQLAWALNELKVRRGVGEVPGPTQPHLGRAVDWDTPSLTPESCTCPPPAAQYVPDPAWCDVFLSSLEASSSSEGRGRSSDPEGEEGETLTTEGSAHSHTSVCGGPVPPPSSLSTLGRQGVESVQALVQAMVRMHGPSMATATALVMFKVWGEGGGGCSCCIFML